MDLKVLFHNPESLTDEELIRLRRKIQLQREMPYGCALFAGLGMYLVDNKMLRRYSDWKRVAVASVLGFAVGAIGTFDSRSVLKRDIDEDILNAYDQKFLNTNLQLNGLGNNYIRGADYSVVNTRRKPY